MSCFWKHLWNNSECHHKVLVYNFTLFLPPLSGRHAPSSPSPNIGPPSSVHCLPSWPHPPLLQHRGLWTLHLQPSLHPPSPRQQLPQHHKDPGWGVGEGRHRPGVPDQDQGWEGEEWTEGVQDQSLRGREKGRDRWLWPSWHARSVYYTIEQKLIAISELYIEMVSHLW